MKRTAIRTGLEALYFTGAHMMMRPFVAGVGVILTLRHVRPPRNDSFQPNRLLEITPPFLDGVLRDLRSAHVDIISLDEMHRRLVEQDFGRRFVCLTFDGGYRDTLAWAYPILTAHQAPFAIYVPTSFPDRLGELWWLAIESVIARNSRVSLLLDGQELHFDCGSVGEKRAAFEWIYCRLRRIETEEGLRRAVRELCTRYDVDLGTFCTHLCLDWNELTMLAADPLVTIGAHSVTHPTLSRVPAKQARSEMAMSRKVIEASLGLCPEHFAYPIGDAASAGTREFDIAAELGFKTAVTTRPGVLFGAHRQHLAALPRISLNGEFQRRRYVRVLLSGAATALWNAVRSPMVHRA